MKPPVIKTEAKGQGQKRERNEWGRISATNSAF